MQNRWRNWRAIRPGQAEEVGLERVTAEMQTQVGSRRMSAIEVLKPFMPHFQVLTQEECARIRSGERGEMNTPGDKLTSHSEEGRCTEQQIQEEVESVTRRVEHKRDVYPQQLSGNPEVSA